MESAPSVLRIMRKAVSFSTRKALGAALEARSLQSLFPLPFFHLNDANVHPRMKVYIWLALAVFVSIILLAITILVTEALPPVFLDPETGQLRYISDGFADYRAAPFVCLAFIMVAMVCILLFGLQGGLHFQNNGEETPTTGCSAKWQLMHVWVPALYATGLSTSVGFGLLASFPAGPIHFSGAAIFISMHIAMQLAFLRIVWVLLSTKPPATAAASIPKSKNVSKMARREWTEVEWCIVGVAITAAILFCVLLVIASSFSQDVSIADPRASRNVKTTKITMYSVSAAAEYFVFAAFILLNLFDSCMMTYVALHFSPSAAAGKQEGDAWVWNAEADDLDEANIDGTQGSHLQAARSIEDAMFQNFCAKSRFGRSLNSL